MNLNKDNFWFKKYKKTIDGCSILADTFVIFFN